MKRQHAITTQSAGRPVGRRGAVTGLLLLGLVFVVGVFAAALDVSRLTNVCAQCRVACQAAALAAAAELIDEGVLVGRPDPSDDVLAARHFARFFASVNSVEGRPVRLDLNLDDDADGDIAVKCVDPLRPIGRASDESAGWINTIRVRCRLHGNVFDRMLMRIGRSLGASNLDFVATAQATLDQRISGFRPEPNVRVPVVPLVAEYDAWMRLATAPAVDGVNDQFAVDVRTGGVVPGADGVPELTLVCSAAPSSVEATSTGNPAAAAAGRCAAMMLDDDGANPWIWSTRCREGLSQQDLKSFGGRLELGPAGLPIPVFPAPPPELPWCLMDVVGASRVWPLGVAAGAGYDVVGFAAGRITAVRPSAGSTTPSWEIVVQPTTLVSSQAVTSPAMAHNPWIGKLELTQ